MKIELRQLRHLLALDKYRNFARAAEAVGITQPALTRSIHTLEDSVGTRLFDRDHSRVEPTLIGNLLIREAQSVLARASDMERVMRRTVDVQAGQLHIGAGPVLVDTSVGTAVARMLQVHPDVWICVDIADWPQLTDRVLSGELEFAVAEASLARDEPRLVVDELPRHRGTWFCRPGHPLTQQPRVTNDDLRRYPLAFMTVPQRLLDAVGHWPMDGAPAGSTETAVFGVHVSSFHMIRQVVRQCDAVSLAVPAQIRDDLSRGLLVELAVDGPPAFTNYGIIRLAHHTLSPAARLFAELLVEIERESSGEPAPATVGGGAPRKSRPTRAAGNSRRKPACLRPPD